MIPPKPRTISLEPIPRRAKKLPRTTSSAARRKSEKEGADLENNSDAAQPPKSPVPEESASQRPSSDHGRVPRSPVASDVQSEASGESAASNSTGMSYRVGAVSPSLNPTGQGGISNGTFDNQTITTTIELLKAGCLPGDSIPLRLTIQHTKFVKSMHGIIITLYRQGRIDYAPPLSMFTDSKGKAAERLKHEEYYPKSKTGLGGLSLSSAGSSSVFRKDLSQTFAPIILDPATLSTVVTTSIRVPDDVFPTITGVPGQMISFRYHIEVVVDLGGKLAAEQNKHLPRFSMTNVSSNFINNSNQMNYRDGGAFPGVLSTWGGSIVDTDHIRREKSVVACLFEVIVGTTDSARHRGRGSTLFGVQNKGQTTVMQHSPTITGTLTHERNTLGANATEESLRNTHYSHHGNTQFPTQAFQVDDRAHPHQGQNVNHVHPQSAQPYAHAFVPMPDVSPDEGLSEKECIRRAEERLLPSQPPEDNEPSSSRAFVPTAPEDSSEDLYSPDDRQLPLTPVRIYLDSEPRSDTLNLADIPSAPSALTLEDLEPQIAASAGEDKREIERLRLMAEASAPPDFPEDDENAREGGSGTQYEATAPILTEEDEYGGHYPGIGEHQEGLPRYER
jgi:arrestin-related trafficking adapter 9